MIPKKIHYCWFGNGPKNELFYKCLESWKKYCPDYEIIEWNESNYDVTKNQYMYEAYQTKRWGFVSDYARLDIVYNEGGIYLDTDVEVVKPLDELLVHRGFAGFEKKYPTEEQKNFNVNTGHGFGAEAGNPVIKKIRDIYENLHFIDKEGKQNLTPCPQYNSIGIAEIGFEMNNKTQEIDGFMVYSNVAFCPITNIENPPFEITDETYSIHYFNTSWLTEKEKKQRQRIQKYDKIIHFPNRLLLKIFGKNKYEKLKKLLKRKN